MSDSWTCGGCQARPVAAGHSPAVTNGCPLLPFTGRDAGDSVASARDCLRAAGQVDHLERGDTSWPRRQQRRPLRNRQPRRPRKRRPRSGRRGVARSHTARGAAQPRPFTVSGNLKFEIRNSERLGLSAFARTRRCEGPTRRSPGPRKFQISNFKLLRHPVPHPDARDRVAHLQAIDDVHA